MTNFDIKSKTNEYDMIFMWKVDMISCISDDPRKKVGAIIGCPDGSIVGMGFNDLRPGTENREEILNNKERKNEVIIHAERNAIDNALNSPNSSSIDWSICSIYVSFAPCEKCARYIIQTDMRRVVFPKMDPSSSWRESAEQAKELMSNAGLELVEVEMQPVLPLNLCA